ncbi:ribonuclease HII [Telmatobacter bradus]|uniref:ribonuclease HII n=1 Tax=Telmatobacter bradus TaxID=474953 RepID=UPI003B4368E5
MSTELVCGWALEEQARSKGALRIAGVDEVGRGPLFGPVVAAAVILPKGCNLPGLNDSKKLNERLRNKLEPEIKAGAVAWAIAEVDAETIDRINIRQASLLAMRRAVEQLALSPDFLLIDGRDTIVWDGPQQAVIKGDATSFSIAAASVLAKVYRDRQIVELDAVYPGYGLARHKGYGCPEHLAALKRLGPTPLHRRSFHGVRQDVLLFDTPQLEDESDEDGAEAEQPLRYACPCCGYLTLAAEPPGTQAICEVCQWEDDLHQFEDPGFEGGANAPSLTEARANYQKIGVSDPHFAGNGRLPLPAEKP